MSIPLDFFAKSHKGAQVLTHTLLRTQTGRMHRPSPTYTAWSQHAPEKKKKKRSKQLNVYKNLC